MPASPSNEAARAELARALFNPRSIALVGASADPAKLASRPQRVLRRYGYPGTIVPINPTRDEIDGDRAWPRLRDVPERPDHAFILVPAGAVPDVIADCAVARVRVATILAAGFAETGEAGRLRQAEIVATARQAGVRLIGPNCLGLVNVHGRMTLSANAVLEREVLRPGGLSVIAQSGSMLGAIITRAQERGLGFSKLVSIGNECDLGVGEITDMLVDDPDTRAILLFLETFRDAPVLAQAARRAHAAGKPIIVYKLGRSAVGREVATTHTGAIAGPDDVADAFFLAHGILRVEVFEALFETAQLVLGHRPPRGRRVAVLTVTGGGAAMVVDQLGLAGIQVVGPTPEVIAHLAARKVQISDATLTDLPMGRADGGIFSSILTEFMRSDHCDAVVAVQGSSATYEPELTRGRILEAELGAKPLATFLAPRAPETLALLQNAGIAAFRSPEACAEAVRAYCDWRAPVPDATAPVPADCSAAMRTAAAAPMTEDSAARALATLGIPWARAQVIRTGRDPVDLPYPLVAKVLSPDIAHKTEAGGVELGISDPDDLARRVDAMLARVRERAPTARIDGVLVQAMERGLAEVIVGFRRDPEVGPVVMLGVGGILAEVASGHAVRIAPVSLETAREMIAAVPGLAVVRGYRNRPAGDLEALARVVRAMSLLGTLDAPRVEEAEINPLLVREDGVVAVDALLRLRAPAATGQ
jgi:acyl-CoA synthetase (NDP forming)